MTRIIFKASTFANACVGAVLALLLGACGNSEKAPAPAAAPAPSVLNDAEAQLRAAGLELRDPLETPAQAYGATECLRGTVDGLELLLCRYPDQSAAAAAETSLVSFVGTALSGATRHRGVLAYAVADRKKADLDGTKMNTLLQTLGTPK